MYASIDAERKEEQLEGAAHHHPPVGVSSALTPTFLSSVPIALERLTATRSDLDGCTRKDLVRATVKVPSAQPRACNESHGRDLTKDRKYAERGVIYNMTTYLPNLAANEVVR